VYTVVTGPARCAARRFRVFKAPLQADHDLVDRCGRRLLLPTIDSRLARLTNSACNATPSCGRDDRLLDELGQRLAFAQDSLDFGPELRVRRGWRKVAERILRMYSKCATPAIRHRGLPEAEVVERPQLAGKRPHLEARPHDTWSTGVRLHVRCSLRSCLLRCQVLRVLRMPLTRESAPSVSRSSRHSQRAATRLRLKALDGPSTALHL